MIYLDNAATTFPKPESVYLEMDRINRNLSVNAGRGSYKAAKEANEIIDETKKKILNLFYASGMADVVFSPSVTHAFNQIFEGVTFSENSVVLISPYEHNAVARTLYKLQKRIGFKIVLLPIKKNSFEIDLEGTQYLIASTKPELIVISAISNVTGYILPFKKIFEMAKMTNTITVLDAAQAAGLIDIDFRSTNADIVAFAGHKSLYGPFGIAGFLINKKIDLSVVLSGGTGSNSLILDMPENSPGKYEASSPNIIAIGGLNAALSELDREQHEKKLRVLTTYALDQLGELSHVEIKGATEDMIGIISFVVDGYQSSDVGQILDEEFDIALRSGYHCAPYIHDVLNDKENGGTVRIGLGLFNTTADIDLLVAALETL